ncbi:MAG: PAS domain S-box protein [Syntrophales bacterium]|jgi:PAS domain S-box-containing protein|nr:PAS domain S-box protein [Syntrophales bacterium]
MKDQSKTKQVLIQELVSLRQRTAELEKSEFERKRAKEALRKSESSMRAITDSAQDAILMMDPEGRISFWNPAAERILGYTSAEAIGQKLHALIAPSRYHEAYHAAFSVFQQKGQEAAVGKTLDLEARRKDGKEISEQLSLSAIHMKGAWHAVGILRDITDRKRAEEALKESKTLLESIFNSSQDLILVVDKDLRVLMSNWKSELYAGHTEFPISSHCYEAFIKRDTPCEPCHALSVFNTGEPILTEYYNEYTKLFMEVNAYPIFDDNNNVIMVAEHVRSITDRKLAEEALRESEERYRVVFEGSIDGILAVDLEAGRFMYCNPSICRMFGYSETEFVLLNIEDIHPAESLDLVKTKFELVRREEKALSSEFPCLRKNGTVFYADITAVGTIINGRKCVVGFFADVTKQKQIEAGLEKTRKELEVIKIAADEVSEFAESIINTVREPLISLDQNLRVVTASRSFYDFFKVNPEDTVGQLIYDLGNKQWDIPKLRELLETILPQETTFDNYEVEHEFATIGRRIMLLNARQIKQVLGKERIILLAIEDITERKRAEEVIKNNMMFQQVLMDAVPSPIFHKDAAGVYIGGNKAFERYLGLSPEQFIGKTVYDLSPVDLAEIYDKADRELLNNPGVQTYEASVVYADGTRRNVVFNKASFTNAEGKIAGLIGVILDITERKKAEEALRDSEHRLHTLVQTIPDLIWMKDKDGVYLSCNTMFERFFGAKEADIVGKTDYDFVNRELADAFRKHDNKAMAAGKTTSNEEWITFASDGHRSFLDTIKTPIYDAWGTLSGVLGIARDITDRMSVDRIRKALGGTVQAIAVTVEARDPYTAGHQRRVADLARAIATEMNLPIDIIDGIRMAAAIHDLGKISVPAEILSKPTKLKKTEFDLIKDHPQSGYDILKDIDFPWPVARIVLEHHERMNGSGYPHGLTGDNILLQSRIISVADVVESMGSHRPYRAALGIEAALEEIERNKGTFYDNTVVDACMRLFREKGFQLAKA